MIRSCSHALRALLLVILAFPLTGEAKIDPQSAERPYPTLSRQALKDLAAEALKEAEKIGDARQREAACPALSLVEALAVGHDFTAAKAAAAKLEGPGEKDWALLIIAVAQAAAGNTAGAKATAADRQDKGFVVDAIIKALYRAGDAAGAKDLAANLSAPEAKIEAYLALAAVQLAAGDKTAAAASVGVARQSVPAITGESGQVKALTQIAGAQAQAGDRAAAKATLEEALALAGHIEKDDSRNVAYSTIAEAQAAAGDAVVAKATINKLSRPEIRPLGRIAQLQAQGGDIAGARATLTEFAGDLFKVPALTAIAVAQAAGGDLAAAKATIAEIQPVGFQEAAIVDIVRSRAAAKDFATAQSAAELSKNPASKVQAFMAIAQGQHQAGAAAAARESLQNAKAVALEMKEPARTIWLSMIINDQIKIADLAGAQATAEQMDSKSTTKVMAYGKLAAARAEAGDPKGAQDFLKIAQDCAAKVEPAADVGAKVEPAAARINAQLMAAWYQAASGDSAGAIQLIGGLSNDPVERLRNYRWVLETMIRVR